MKITYDELNKTVWLFATPEEITHLAVAMRDRLSSAELGQSLAVFNQGIDNSEMVFSISVDQTEACLHPLKSKVDEAFWEFNENQSPENLQKLKEAWEKLKYVLGEGDRP